MLVDKIAGALELIKFNEGEKFVVIEFEFYNGEPAQAFLVDIEDGTIIKNKIYGSDKDVSDLGEIDITEFDVADVDVDYIFNTEYPLVRIQCNIEKICLKNYDVNFNIYSSFVVQARTEDEARAKFFQFTNEEILWRLADDLSSLDVGTIEELDEVE